MEEKRMRYKASKSLEIRFGRKGDLVATTSISRLPQKITPEGIYVLRAFGKGRTPGEVKKILEEEWEFDENGFNEVFEKLLSENFLVPAEIADQKSVSSTLAGRGFSLLQVHHIMMRDSIRVNSFRKAISANVQGKFVVEIGCGTGILSLFAAQSGARRVVAIEESEIVELAREMVRVNGYESVIKVIAGSSRDVELEEPADVIIHEIIGNDPFTENILSYVADARERFFAGPRGFLIPGRLKVFCVGIEIEKDDLVHREQEIKEAAEFGRQYDLDYTPYIESLARGREFRHFSSRNIWDNFPYRVLSRESLLYDIDFSSDWGDIEAPRTRILEIEKQGDLNGVVTFFRAFLDERTQLTNSPFSPKTHWDWDVRCLAKVQPVNPGEKVEINAELVHENKHQKMLVDFKVT